jgi:hypothetical protein
MAEPSAAPYYCALFCRGGDCPSQTVQNPYYDDLKG